MSGLVRSAKKSYLDGGIPMLTDSIKLVLVNLAAVTGAFVKVVSAATNASPSVLTITSHGYTNGDFLSISGATGNTNINGLRKLVAINANTFSLTDKDGTAIAGNGTFGGTCYVINLSVIDFLDDIDAGARIATSSALGSKTTTAGVFSFAAYTFATVTGSAAQCVFLYDSTPSTDATRPLIAVDDAAANLPVTPNGGDISYTPNASGMFEL